MLLSFVVEFLEYAALSYLVVGAACGACLYVKTRDWRYVCMALVREEACGKRRLSRQQALMLKGLRLARLSTIAGVVLLPLSIGIQLLFAHFIA